MPVRIALFENLHCIKMDCDFAAKCSLILGSGYPDPVLTAEADVYSVEVYCTTYNNGDWKGDSNAGR